MGFVDSPSSNRNGTGLGLTLEIFGETELRSRGHLQSSAPRELVVDQSLPAAFEQSGLIAADTRRLWGRHDRLPDEIPDRLPTTDVVAMHRDETVWAGCILSHYGHFLTESVSRLWPLLPGAELEGLPVVFSLKSKAPFASEWADAFGIDLVELPEAGAVHFLNMFVPEPAWKLNAWIAPEIRDIHIHARQGLHVPVRPKTKVLWLSRSTLSQSHCAYDERLLEWILRDHVTLMHPEKTPLVEQIAMIEASEVVAGIVGSAFHTLLMAMELPMCFFLCPGSVQSAFLAQSRLLNVDGTFVHALSIAEMLRRRRSQSMGGYRMLIPEAVRALGESVLRELLDDEMVHCFAYPEKLAGAAGTKVGIESIKKTVARVLLDPYSFEARMKLATAFEERGEYLCALEQFLTVAELSDDRYVPSLLGACQMFDRLGQARDASSMARLALSADPECRNALSYLATE